MTPWERMVRWQSARTALALGLLLVWTTATASALTTIHGLGFDTSTLASLADQAADAAVSELPIGETDKAVLSSAIRLGLLDVFLPYGPETQLFDNDVNNVEYDIDFSPDTFGNPLTIARGDFNEALGVVSPFVGRVLGAPRLELIVATEPLSEGGVDVRLWSNGYGLVVTSGYEISGSADSEFLFDADAAVGWLLAMPGASGSIPGVDGVNLVYAEAESPNDDPATLSWSTTGLDAVGGPYWIGSATATPGAHVIYYFDVALDTPIPTPDGSFISGMLLPDPHNLQWVDRGALDRLAAAGAGFGDPGDVNTFDPSDPTVGQRFASIAVRELLGSGDLGLASTFSIPDDSLGQLWHVPVTQSLSGVPTGDYYVAVDVWDGGSIVASIEPVSIRLDYDPEATMNLSTAAATVLDNELFTVGAGFSLAGIVKSGDGMALTGDDGVTIHFMEIDGAQALIVPDEAGAFGLTLPEGIWVATASGDGFGEYSVEFELFVGATLPELEFVLTADLDYVPEQHQFIEGETELFGNAGEVTGGVPPYEYVATGGTAAFWLNVDPATGDLIFADGATAAPGPGQYELSLDVNDSEGTTFPGGFGVQVESAPESSLQIHGDAYGFPEGSPYVMGATEGSPYVMGAVPVSGGIEPYTFAVAGGSAAPWLDVHPETGELVLADGTSFVPAPGLYELEVEVTDSAELPDTQPGFAHGAVHVAVRSPNIAGVQYHTGDSSIRQKHLDDGPVTVILNVEGDAAALANVTLVAGEHVISETPDAAGNAAFIFLSTEHILNPSTSEPVYGRYALSYTPNGGPERMTSQFVNIAQTPDQAWQGHLGLGHSGLIIAVAELGAAINAFDGYNPVEDIVAPPLPDPGAEPNITFWRDGIALSRDIVATPIEGPLTWHFDITVPEYDLYFDWSFEQADSHYDRAVLEDLDSGETWEIYDEQPIIPAGAHSYMLTLDRSPFQRRWLELAPRWTLMSLPGPTVEGSPAILLDLLDVDTVFGWSPEYGYEEPQSEEPLDHVVRGYFVHRSSELDYAGATVMVELDDPTAVEADIHVETGWNILGVVEGGIEAGALSPHANTVFRWEAHDWAYSQPLSSGGLLTPFEGVWVFNPGDPYFASVTQLRFRSGPAADPVPALVQPDWMVALRMDSADGQQRRLELGSGALAEAGYDAMDIVTPPPPAMREYAEFYADVDHIAGRLARSIQPLDRDGGEWSITARLPGDGAIRWDGVDLPMGYRLTLEVEGRRYDMLRRGEAALRGGSHSLRVSLAWAAPQHTRLLSNYPNPFNPETWIPFELSAASAATVRVYDFSGQVVRRIDLGYREAGYYTARAEAAYWDGRNDLGERVASGVYFYELRAGAERSLRRMVVNK